MLFGHFMSHEVSLVATTSKSLHSPAWSTSATAATDIDSTARL